MKRTLIRRRIVSVGIAAICSLLVWSSAFAEVPATMPVQGYVSDAEDVPLDGVHALTFSIYDAAEDGTALWTQTVDVDVQQGSFVTYLGAGDTPLDLSIFTDTGSRYLGVTVGDDEEMQPRFELGAVPYARVAEYAAVADTLQGMSPDDFAKAGDVGWDEVQDVPPPLAELAALSCSQGQVARFDGTAWTCATNTLDSLGCAVGEVPSWDGADWSCSSRDATYAAVASSGSFLDLIDVPAGLADGDDDTLAALGCAADEIAKWDGSTWACATDIDTDTTLDEAAVDGFVANNGYITDADDDDTLAALGCGTDEVAKWDGAAWVCATDIDTDTDTNLDEAAVDGFVANNGYITDADDDDTLAALSCANGELPKWNGSTWACAADIDTDTNLDEAAVDSYVANNGYLTQSDGDARYIQQGASNSITSDMIQDGQIVDADVAASANIAPSKIAGTAATLTGDQSFDGGTFRIDAANNRVGVNAAPTTDFEVGGTAAANDYRYRARKTSFTFIDAFEFTRMYEDPNYPYRFDPNRGFMNYVANGARVFMGSVNVPHGARIDRVTCHYAADITFALWRRSHLGTSPARLNIASFNGTGSPSFPVSEVTDYSRNTYYVTVDIRGINRFNGCGITYSTDRVLP